MESPKTLLEAIQYFSDEQVCIDTVASMRWMNGAICPDCETGNPYYLKTQKRWKCRECRRQFSVKVNSIFEDSPISLCKWLPALWLLVNCKNGVSSYEIARDLGVTQKSAWFMLQRLRLALKSRDFSHQMGGDEGGGVEVDETYVGGKVKNMHKSRKLKIAKAHSLMPAWKSTDNPLNDSDRFMLALSQVAGKRLTYAELTGKTERPAF
jgi:transposase-like protein